MDPDKAMDTSEGTRSRKEKGAVEGFQKAAWGQEPRGGGLTVCFIFKIIFIQVGVWKGFEEALLLVRAEADLHFLS